MDDFLTEALLKGHGDPEFARFSYFEYLQQFGADEDNNWVIHVPLNTPEFRF